MTDKEERKRGMEKRVERMREEERDRIRTSSDRISSGVTLYHMNG